MHRMYIENFGPIKKFGFEINDYTVVIGEEGSGTHTICALIYFFRTIKDEFIKDTSENIVDISTANIKEIIEKRFYDLFDNKTLFGRNSLIRYEYSEQIYIALTLKHNNSIGIEISNTLDENITSIFKPGYEQSYSKSILASLFNDETSVVHIPSGWNLVNCLYNKLHDNSGIITDQLMTSLVGKLRHTQGDLHVGYLTARDSITENLPVKKHYDLLIRTENNLVLSVLSKITEYNRKVFLIVEEPEIHLSPLAQTEMVDFLSRVIKATHSQLLMTTHSPYILASFNNLIYANSLGQRDENREKISAIVDCDTWIDINKVSAFNMKDGGAADIIDKDLNLIKVEEIDKASEKINQTFDELFELDEVEERV
ncbi:MAG: AAA family ATPase [Magnetococcales bacterium]|nr:AAA family ATPase [Nitrospirota bacterium]